MKIRVTGAGMTAFGEWWEEGVISLAKKAAEEALKEAKVPLEEIDLLVVGNMLISKLTNQSQVGSYLAEGLGYTGKTLYVEAACASGGMAVRQAVMALRSGSAKRVLVVGVEKMTDVSIETITTALMGAAGDQEQLAGATFPSLYGMMHRLYQQEFKVTDKQMAASAVKNHRHASLNPMAQLQKEITIKEVLESALVADPIRLLHCSPISDGAAALVLERTEDLKTGDVEIAGIGQGNDSLSLAKRKNIISLEATRKAIKEALVSAQEKLSAIGLVELHDCFSIAEIMALEDMGLVPVGKGAMELANGFGRLGGGGVVINASGGLKAGGHPVGATGVKQVVEIYKQLRELSGKRQVANARVGLTHNVGGTGATAIIHILRRWE